MLSHHLRVARHLPRIRNRPSRERYRWLLKTPSPEISQNKSALGCPTNGSLNFLDICHAHIFAVWKQIGLFEHPA